MSTLPVQLRPLRMTMPRLGRARTRKAGLFGLVTVAGFLVVALFAPLVANHDPNAISGPPLSAPTTAHWLGTDDIGRDVWSYVAYGTRVSLQIGVCVAAATLLLGVIVGSLAGYLGGIVDACLIRIAEFFQIIPGFVLALVIIAILGQNVWLTVFALGITMWPRTARIIRAQFLSLKNQEFVEAARSQGFGSRFIVVRDILPNALPAAVIQATLDVGMAILMEAGLSFLGLGDPNRPSWGQMLNRAQEYLVEAPWMSLAPGFAIFFIVLGINLLGDMLNDWIDVASRGAGS